MFDPLLTVFEKILEKYLKDKLKGIEKFHLLTELRRLAYNYSIGNIDEDDIRAYLSDLLDTMFYEELDEDLKNKLINDFIKAMRVEKTSRTLSIPRKPFGLT